MKESVTYAKRQTNFVSSLLVWPMFSCVNFQHVRTCDDEV